MPSCPDCDQSFGSKWYLRRHVGDAHPAGSYAARRMRPRYRTLSRTRLCLALILLAGSAVFIWVFPAYWLLICLVAVVIGFALPRSIGGFGGGGFHSTIRWPKWTGSSMGGSGGSGFDP